jgi:hypothetical protein
MEEAVKRLQKVEQDLKLEKKKHFYAMKRKQYLSFILTVICWLSASMVTLIDEGQVDFSIQTIIVTALCCCLCAFFVIKYGSYLFGQLSGNISHNNIWARGQSEAVISYQNLDKQATEYLILVKYKRIEEQELTMALYLLSSSYADYQKKYSHFDINRFDTYRAKKSIKRGED